VVEEMYRIPEKPLDVYEARARVERDKQSGKQTPDWVVRLAETDTSLWDRWEENKK